MQSSTPTSPAHRSKGVSSKIGDRMSGNVRNIIPPHHKAQTPTPSGSVFHWIPLTPLPRWEISLCAAGDGDFATSLLPSTTNRSQAAPRRLQMLSKIHPHTRLVLFPPGKAQPLLRAELPKHSSHPLAPRAQLSPDPETNLGPPVPSMAMGQAAALMQSLA